MITGAHNRCIYKLYVLITYTGIWYTSYELMIIEYDDDKWHYVLEFRCQQMKSRIGNIHTSTPHQQQAESAVGIPNSETLLERCLSHLLLLIIYGV